MAGSACGPPRWRQPGIDFAETGEIMKVLVLEWNGFGFPDMIDAFGSLGHEVSTIPFPKDEDPRHNPAFESTLTQKIEQEKPDFLFTFNYFPVISVVAKKTDTKAVFWVYDSPLVLLYCYTIIYPQNYVFVFDKSEYMKFHRNGINTVYYLPLASAPKRLSSYDITEKRFTNSTAFNRGDVAFVGSMYTEKHTFFRRLENISDYTKGYLEGLIEAQKKVWGYNFIEELLTKEIMDDMHKDLPMEVNPDGVETVEYLYAQYVINREITARERSEYINAILEAHTLDLYTNEKELKLPNCVNHGPVNPYDGAPYIFRNAKINLNLTLRSITSGIPFRAFEILASGGFLLTNYQADFDDCYTAFEDYVYFESKEDMLSRIDYYLSHESERKEIAENGLRKTFGQNTYGHRIEEILRTLAGNQK